MGQSQSSYDDEQHMLQKICEETHFDAKEVADMYKKFHQEFEEGAISKRAFIEMYVNMFPKGDARAFAELIFNAYDADGNGEIDFREFMRTLSVTTKGSVEEKLHWAFRLYDLDGDGTVSRQEAIDMIEAIYRMRGHRHPHDKAVDSADRLFLHLDKNQDDRLSEEEFTSAVKASKSIRDMIQGAI